MLPYLLSLLSIGALWLLLAQALNLQYGFLGLANFGIVGFYAVGAYATAILETNGWPIVAAIPTAIVVATLLAALIGSICLRLRADYLGIVTLSFAEIVRITLISEEGLTNGVRGISGIPPIAFESLGLGPDVAFPLVALAVDLVVAAMILLLVRSPFGRTIRAIRDDEPAVAAIGKRALSFKRRVLMFGSAVTSLAGALYAHHIGYISPDQFLPITTFYVWIAVIVGGAGRLRGALIGTLILTLFLEGSRFLRDVVPGVSEVEMASLRLAVVGLALMLMTVLRPQGVAGDYTSK